MTKKEYNHKYYIEHKEKIRENNRVASNRYYHKNKTKKLEYRKYHKEYKKEYDRVRREKLKNIIRLKKTKYHNIKYKTDIGYRLVSVLRSRLCSAIKHKSKKGSFIRDMGCSIPELKIHLESKFGDGMTWDNWGRIGWHIDHIIPLSKFNLNNRDEFLTACNYKNLQPLWAEENRIKSNKISNFIK